MQNDYNRLVAKNLTPVPLGPRTPISLCPKLSVFEWPCQSLGRLEGRLPEGISDRTSRAISAMILLRE